MTPCQQLIINISHPFNCVNKYITDLDNPCGNYGHIVELIFHYLRNKPLFIQNIQLSFFFILEMIYSHKTLCFSSVSLLGHLGHFGYKTIKAITAYFLITLAFIMYYPSNSSEASILPALLSTLIFIIFFLFIKFPLQPLEQND